MDATAADVREATSAFSPFVAAGVGAEAPAIGEPESAIATGTSLSSPFSDGFVSSEDVDRDAQALEVLLAELEDEDFDDALEALVDETAARHLRATASWSSEFEAPELPTAELEAWIAQLATEADRALERLELQFADRAPDALSEDEVETATREAIEETGFAGAAMDQLFGGLVSKAIKLGKGIVKAGLSTVGKLTTGWVFAALRKLLPSLFKWVVRKGSNRLPAKMRPAAADLARRVLGEFPESDTVAEASSRFDTQLVHTVLAPTDTRAEQVRAEAVDEAAWAEHDPLATLDAARARLARQLAEASPGEPLVAQLQQFIPAVMAALPAIRAGMKLIGGRKAVRKLLTSGLEKLIEAHVGPAAARALARPIVDVGLRALRLEAESPELLGAEAMVATLEDTIGQVLSLPEESLDEPLRVEAEIQEAFTEAATRHLPRDVLRADLPAYETSGESGVWVFMPRATRPCYRYKKFSRVYRVPISRPQARAIVLNSGDTLEGQLLDAGTSGWPVPAELHLYETLPGTHLGHLAAFEDDASRDEFEDLTPEAAALLVGEPGLGRRALGPRRGRASGSGRRLYRIVVPGSRLRRRLPRFVVRLDAVGAKPALRVHLRLSEREAHDLSGRLTRPAHAQVVAFFRGVLGPAARTALAKRLIRRSSRVPGAAFSPARAQALAGHISEAILAILAKQLPAAAASLREAARDPAAGLTLSFSFVFASRASLTSGMPEPPTLTIRPGYRRD